MATINQLQDEIIEEFEGFDDWMDRYAYIIELGNAMPALDEQYKTPDNLIDGCQSRVWLQADYTDGVIHLQADSDALIVKGIVSMLVRVLDGQSPRDILTPTSTSSTASGCTHWPTRWPITHKRSFNTLNNKNNYVQKSSQRTFARRLK